MIKIFLTALFLCLTGGAAMAADTLNTPLPAAPNTPLEKAYFAGGCFWCMEASYESLSGVTEAISGYMTLPDTTKPTEVIEVHYYPQKVTYAKLLDIFWLNIDPDDEGGQFYDRGDAYRTAIFYQNETEKAAALKSKKAAEEELNRPLKPMIVPATIFTKAEDSHQDYYKTNSVHYNSYKYGSGRPAKLKQIWGDKGGAHE